MNNRACFYFVLVLLGALVASFYGWRYYQSGFLTDSEQDIARGLTLSHLPALPPSPGNAVADDRRAAKLGATLFKDTGLSVNGKVACVNCHQADKRFQDGLPVGHGISDTQRRTMPLEGAAWQAWFFWDGRKDSLWSQALGPLESRVEHGLTRTQIAAYVVENYGVEYTEIFGAGPDLSNLPAASPLGNATQVAIWNGLPAETRNAVNRVFANTGKVIAAFERQLIPPENKLDAYMAALDAGSDQSSPAMLSRLELDGFRVFSGKGHCINCHNGPLFSDGFFHNTAVPAVRSPFDDHGRANAIPLVLNDPFNCLGAYSDAAPTACRELQFMLRDSAVFERAFKTPTLRGVNQRAPYMHAGQFATLEQVVDHYNRPHLPPAGHREISRLRLSGREKAALLAFLNLL